VEFSFEALEEAAVGFQRIEGFLARASAALGADQGWFATMPPEFTDAMNDDLGTPGAVAVLFDRVREGNTALAGNDTASVQRILGEVTLMLDVLGLNPADEAWGAPAGGDEKLHHAVDVLVKSLIDQRAAAREAKDWAAADAIRDQLKEAGVEIADSPSGPTWSVN
jgi:cysteinyl-tRNA synthetase